jgi:hypothetical protein
MLFVDAGNDRVGIGTNSPSYLTEISGNGSGDTVTLALTNAGPHPARLRLNSSHGNWSVGNSISVADALEFRDESASSTRMLIDSSGNVGISEASPDTKLHLTDHTANAGPVIRLEGNSQNTAGNLLGGIECFNADASGDGPNVVSAIKFLAHSAIDHGGQITFSTHDGTEGGEGSAPVERVRIDQDGNVGIGTTPDSPLHVIGDGKFKSSGEVKIRFQNDTTGTGSSDGSFVGLFNGSDGMAFYNYEATPMRFFTSNAERLHIDGNGTTTATSNAGHTCLRAYQPTTNSSRSVVQVLSNVTSTEQVHCKIFSDGDILNTNNSYGALSDETLKENVADAGSQWADIKAVQVRKYSMIDEEQDAANRIGVIAQELEIAGMNGLVRIEEDGLKSVKYSVLYMKAVKALQEAIAKIETLETKVAALEAKIGEN